MATRIAIFSDLHGSSAATAATLAAIDAAAPDTVYCLGDLVGYGARPNETIELVRGRGIPTIMGNYDDGVGFDRDDCGCAYGDKDEEARGQASLFWSRRVTTDENKAYLRSLPPELRFEAEGVRFRLVHGSPRRMNEYLFEDRDPRTLARIARDADCDVLVFGHTHQPWIREVEGVLLVNDGSAGKPKDGDPRAAWALFDIAPGRPPAFWQNGTSRTVWQLVDVAGGKPVSVGIVRVPYDVATMADAIRAADGLPDHFARDLETAGLG